MSTKLQAISISFLLMLYAVGIFTYLTSSIASALIAGDRQRPTNPPAATAPVEPAPPAGRENGNTWLSQREIEALRAILSQTDALRTMLDKAEHPMSGR